MEINDLLMAIARFIERYEAKEGREWNENEKSIAQLAFAAGAEWDMERVLPQFEEMKRKLSA